MTKYVGIHRESPLFPPPKSHFCEALMPTPPADPELKQHIMDTARAVHQYGAQSAEAPLQHTATSSNGVATGG